MSQLALRLITENKAAHERGEDARLLDLGNCGLTELPEELFKCVWLEELIVSNSYNLTKVLNRDEPNKLKNISKEIPKLINLKVLRIGGRWNDRWELNELNMLAKMTGLQSLDLSYNQITEVNFLRDLTGLQSLNLSHNQLTDVQFLRELTHLQFLSLNSNRLKDLSFLRELTGLKSLDISDNQLADLNFIRELIGLRSLYLSFNELIDVGCLLKLTELQSLDISYNQLTNVQFLRELTELQSLNLSYNQLTDADFLYELTGLQSLNLSENQLTEVDFLHKLTKLQSLDLSYNKLTGVELLGYLTGLQSLNLAHNQLTNIQFLRELTHLQSLDLSYNELTDVRFLCELTELRSLNLNDNQLTEVGFLHKLTKLEYLDIHSNKLEDLGFMNKLAGLYSLDLRRNKIKEISIAFLEGFPLELELEKEFGLGKVLLKDNPIENPPIDVLKQGREFAIEYLKIRDKQPLNECKVIIVGRGGVGKTSLQKRLINQPFDAKESQTHGIRKVSWADGVKAGNGKPITIHFWDFGGQDIQQTLHQFFYSKNTLYILVLNKRHDEDPEDFLELIRTYGHNSPVLIAYNTMINLDEKGIASYDLTPELDSSLRSKYPNIRERTFGLCCGQEQDKGVDALRHYLQGYIPTLDHVREPYPRSWLTIKQELLDKVQSNYIQYEEYEALCQTNQVEKQEIQKGLAEMLNSVGTITFFDRQFLGNYYILNPDWLTTGAYQIIDSEQTTQKKGRINADDLRIIFNQKNLQYSYRPSDYEFLLQLMEEFDLCHRFERGEWLIPSSLEGNSKTDLVAYKKDEYRQYNLQYEVSLPHSIIHRFIARNIKYANQDDYWRNGIVVKHPDSDTVLYVEADRRERQIRLFVKGGRIRDGWEYFRKDLKEFSGDFKYEELVILPSGDAVSYQYLMDAWEMGKQEVFISKKTGDINVQEALGLFEKRNLEKDLLQSRGQIRNPKPLPQNFIEILSLIDQNKLFDAFEKMDELGWESSNLSKLQDEFEGGHQGVDYIQRLKMCVKRLSR